MEMHAVPSRTALCCRHTGGRIQDARFAALPQTWHLASGDLQVVLLSVFCSAKRCKTRSATQLVNPLHLASGLFESRVRERAVWRLAPDSTLANTTFERP